MHTRQVRELPKSKEAGKCVALQFFLDPAIRIGCAHGLAGRRNMPNFAIRLVVQAVAAKTNCSVNIVQSLYYDCETRTNSRRTNISVVAFLNGSLRTSQRWPMSTGADVHIQRLRQVSDLNCPWSVSFREEFTDRSWPVVTVGTGGWSTPRTAGQPTLTRRPIWPYGSRRKKDAMSRLAAAQLQTVSIGSYLVR